MATFELSNFMTVPVTRPDIFLFTSYVISYIWMYSYIFTTYRANNILIYHHFPYLVNIKNLKKIFLANVPRPMVVHPSGNICYNTCKSLIKSIKSMINVPQWTPLVWSGRHCSRPFQRKLQTQSSLMRYYAYSRSCNMRVFNNTTGGNTVAL
jgi:hypothetical protein